MPHNGRPTSYLDPADSFRGAPEHCGRSRGQKDSRSQSSVSEYHDDPHRERHYENRLREVDECSAGSGDFTPHRRHPEPHHDVWGQAVRPRAASAPKPQRPQQREPQHEVYATHYEDWLRREVDRSAHEIVEESAAEVTGQLRPLHIKIDALEARMQDVLGRGGGSSSSGHIDKLSSAVTDLRHRLEILETSTVRPLGDRIRALEEQVAGRFAVSGHSVDSQEESSARGRRRARAQLEIVRKEVDSARERLAAEAVPAPSCDVAPAGSLHAVPQDLLRRVADIEQRLTGHDEDDRRFIRIEQQLADHMEDLRSSKHEQRSLDQAKFDRVLELERRLTEHEKGLADFPAILDHQLSQFERGMGLTAQDAVNNGDYKGVTVSAARMLAESKLLDEPDVQAGREIHDSCETPGAPCYRFGPSSSILRDDYQEADCMGPPLLDTPLTYEAQMPPPKQKPGAADSDNVPTKPHPDQRRVASPAAGKRWLASTEVQRGSVVSPAPSASSGQSGGALQRLLSVVARRPGSRSSSAAPREMQT